jgi:Cu/Ag efflux protein CusF
MKSSKAFAAIAIALLVTVSLTAAPLQQAPPGGPPAGQAPERGGPGAQAPPAGGPPAGGQQQTATGQLAKVDAAAKEITIKSGDKEMVLAYNDATQITGVAGGAQGLTGKTGETLRVTYQSRGGANLASRIEVQEAKK